MSQLFETFVNYVRGIWRFRWYILFVAWPLCILGWLAVYSMPDVYAARAQVFIDTKSVLTPLLDGLAVDTEIEDRVGVLTQALLSRPSLEKIARNVDPTFSSKSKAAQARILAHMENRIATSKTGRNTYEIEYHHPDRDRAVRVVELLLDRLVKQTKGVTRTDTAAAQEFLSRQIAQHEKRLTRAEQGLAQFKRKHVDVMPRLEGDYYGRLQSTMDQLEQTRNGLALAIKERDELKRQLEGKEPAARVLSETDRRIQKNLDKLSQLRLRFTEQHPDIIALKETIKQLRAQKESEPASADRGSVGSNLGSQFDSVYGSIQVALSKANVKVSSLQAKVKGLESKVEALQQNIDTIPDVEAKLSQLNRDYAITKTRYQELVKRRESAALSEAADKMNNDSQFRIVQPPLASTRPVWPRRSLFLTVVLGGGLSAGLAFALLLDQIRPVFWSANGLRGLTSLPVFGVVSRKPKTLQRLRMRAALACWFAIAIALLGAYGGAVVLEQPASRIVQSFTSDLGA